MPRSFSQLCASVTATLANGKPNTEHIIDSTLSILRELAEQNLPLEELNGLILWRRPSEPSFCGLFNPATIGLDGAHEKILFKPGLRLFNPDNPKQIQGLQKTLEEQCLIEEGSSSLTQTRYLLEAFSAWRLFARQSMSPSERRFFKKGIRNSGYSWRNVMCAIRTIGKYFEANQLGAMVCPNITRTLNIIHILNPDASIRVGGQILPTGLLKLNISFENILAEAHKIWLRKYSLFETVNSL